MSRKRHFSQMREDDTEDTKEELEKNFTVQDLNNSTLDSSILYCLRSLKITNLWEKNLNSFILKYIEGSLFAKCTENCNSCSKSNVASRHRSHAKCEDVTFHLVDTIVSTLDYSIKFRHTCRDDYSTIKFGLINKKEWKTFKLWTNWFQAYYGKEIILRDDDTVEMLIKPSSNTIIYNHYGRRGCIREDYVFDNSNEYKVYVEFHRCGTKIEII